jgi:hypothetical protein
MPEKPISEIRADAARRPPHRIEIRLPPEIGATQERELAALVRYCVLKTERALGVRGQWTVTLGTRDSGELESTVAFDDGNVVDSVAIGRDAALATWDAMCGVERTLRDRYLS